MKVLLREDIHQLGDAGEVVDVTDGYARNYLLPQQLALAPTEANLKRVEAEKAERARRFKARLDSLRSLASRINETSVTIKAKANELGHLFGSVNERHIADALAAEGFTVQPEQIALAAPIRTLDKFRVPIHLAEDIDAEIDVWVVPSS